MENTENYAVAVSYNDALGWIELDEAAHKIDVTLFDDEGKQKAEDYLAQIHTINVPQESMHDFRPEEIDATKDKRSFIIALTRMWEATGVHVDWSRPVDYVKAHPHY